MLKVGKTDKQKKDSLIHDCVLHIPHSHFVAKGELHCSLLDVTNIIDGNWRNRKFVTIKIQLCV